MITKLKKEHMTFMLLISVGVFLRFFVMTLGHNFDFESYCIVGEIAGNFRNVYAETGRYNYGPIFLCIQGLLYRISHLSSDWQIAYRVLMVSTLTLADLGIASFVANRYDTKKALIFFLNPVSILITGYHNQFDNIAVFLALMTILFYNEEKKFNKKDMFFVLFLSLCLITKHILFIFPLFILLKKGLPIKKKILYAFVPPAIFLLSFLPFALQSSEAFNGILRNVFLYRSFNNSPLLYFVYQFIGFPNQYQIYVFGIGMAIGAFLIRNKNYEEELYLYLIAMIALSSAVTNQYLVIPIVAIIILNKGIFRYLYILAAFVFLALDKNGLDWYSSSIVKELPHTINYVLGAYLAYGYIVLTWILFVTLLYNVCLRDKISKKALMIRKVN